MVNGPKYYHPEGQSVALSCAIPGKLVKKTFEGTHILFHNFPDCRPILVRQAMNDAGFRILYGKIMKMWINAELVHGLKRKIKTHIGCCSLRN
jgi:hypothetical protein